MNSQSAIAGIIAGFASAFLLVVAFSLGAMGVLFAVLFGAVPVYVATMGWGGLAGFVASAILALSIGFSTNIGSGLMVTIVVAVPAAIAGYQANLAQLQPDQQGKMVWFPLSSILFSLALNVAIAITIFGMAAGYDPSSLQAELAAELQTFFSELAPQRKFSNEELADIVALNLQILPFVIAAFWVLVHALDYLMATRILARMGRQVRPREDIAQNLNLPRLALLLLVAGLLVSLAMASPISLVGNVFSGSFVAAFSLVGLAATHAASRNWFQSPQVRRFALIFIYMTIILFSLPVLLFTIVGILRSASDSPPTNPPNGSNTNS